MGTQELLIVLAIVIVLFGAKKLPGLARSVGESLGEFRRATAEQDEAGDEESASTSDEV